MPQNSTYFSFNTRFETTTLDAFVIAEPSLLKPEKVGGENLNSPIILSVPHGGRFYPSEMVKYANLKEMRTLEDIGSDVIVMPLINSEQSAIKANCSRAIIDVNRPKTALDPKLNPIACNGKIPTPNDRWQRYINSGYGVIPRLSSGRHPLYKREPTISSVEKRIKCWHQPFHELISEAVDESQKLFQRTLLLDIHTMPQSSPKLPDIVIGNLNGVSASKEFIYLITNILEQFDLTYSMNIPYAGGYITEHHGDPSEHRHAIQIEINRNLYLSKNYIINKKNINELSEVLKRIIESVSSVC